jgi:Family of unknown function (DUF5989)
MTSRQSNDDFSSMSDAPRPGIVRELIDFLLHNKKWWLAPIVVVLLLVGGMLIIGATAAAPIIYTLF